jgi:16S rRNA (guanine966-N2)-methyltransferase
MFDVLLALPEVAAAAPDAGGSLEGHAVLDLFAGSGALGLEALSRGASSCTFVESAPAAARVLRDNLARVGVPVSRADESPPAASAARSAVRSAGNSADPPGQGAAPRAVVLALDARRALAADARRAARYTLVFADPPYDRYEQVLPALARLLGRVLAPGAVLVVESAARTPAGLPWRVVREKRYGDTRVTVLVADEPGSAEGAAANDDRPAS